MKNWLELTHRIVIGINDVEPKVLNLHELHIDWKNGPLNQLSSDLVVLKA